ncbi:hypothetical protein A9Q84_10805 [Halobacteriovorax marinus]|uniref:Calcineurin-like phosphoesterase domain-containing protein n=1 Tax=Halobacteriovorax marinus TaxID=97084 RepID=A0A1Y5FD85_9BACT|nr:hypothetical protein A9Q84_10805 [Halobacteriovorax marinus]
MNRPQHHTIVISDLHLSDAEPIHENNPLWKKFRRKEYFIDKDVAAFLEKLDAELEAPIELVLNGDIFDFDSVMSVPKHGEFSFSSNEKHRGLNSEEHKSEFKMMCILRDHSHLCMAFQNFLQKGHKIIFTIGNHDLELHWPKVQQALINAIVPNNVHKEQVVICEWFYLSGGDTLIEHGNQYDPYCLCANPINPLVRKGRKDIVRLPFGNLANRYMVNGMGLKNPHHDSSFIMSGLGFMIYFFKYELRIQPFLLVTWLLGALRTLIVYTKEAWLPPLKDPLTLTKRIEEIAKRSQATANQLLMLRAFHAHPASYNPFMVLRELWLDRAILLMVIVWGCFQIFSTTNVVVEVSYWWFLVPLFICLPFFAWYSQGVNSDVRAHAKAAESKISPVGRAFGVSRIIQGHTHRLGHRFIDSVEYINTGAWTQLFHDVECEKPYGRKPFAWIKPTSGNHRTSNLYEWKNGEFLPIGMGDKSAAEKLA